MYMFMYKYLLEFMNYTVSPLALVVVSQDNLLGMIYPVM